MIEFQKVTRTFSRKVAVNELELTVPTGELFALLGPNGAGKTTTIKMVVGLLRPSAGVVKVCGVDVVRNPREANRHLGYVPDEPYLYDKLTGREFLQFISQMYGLEPEQARASMAREIANFEVEEFLDELTEHYSHGMKQRLVFTAAMLHNPDVLILDEPMVGLDPRSMWLVKDLLKQKAAAGMTVFMSTHTLAIAEEIADRIGIVNHGRLGFLGTLGELRSHLDQQEMSLEQLYLRLIANAEGLQKMETHEDTVLAPSKPR